MNINSLRRLQILSLCIFISCLIVTSLLYIRSGETQTPTVLKKVPGLPNVVIGHPSDLSSVFGSGYIAYGDFLPVSINGRSRWRSSIKVLPLTDSSHGGSISSFEASGVRRTFDPQFSPSGQLIMFKAGGFGERYSRYRFSFWDRKTRKIQSGPDKLIYLKAWWSLDGNYVAYIDGGDVEGNEAYKDPLKLYVYDLKSQISRLIATNGMVKYLAWSSDDTLLYSMKRSKITSNPTETDISLNADVYSVSAQKGESQLYIKNGFDPRPSMDGKKIAFFAWPEIDNSYKSRKAPKINSKIQPQIGLYVYDTATKQRSLLYPAFSHVSFGDLIWLKDNKHIVYFQMVDRSPNARAQFGIIDTTNSTIRKLSVLQAHDYESISRLDTRPQISLIGVSKDDQFLYLKVSEYIGEDEGLYVEEMSIQALNLNSGKITIGAKVQTSYGIDWHDKPSTPAPSIDALKNGQRSTLSRYKVDFPRLYGANDYKDLELYKLGRGRNSYKQTENGHSRYTYETVRINLRTFTGISGTGITKWPQP